MDASKSDTKPTTPSLHSFASSTTLHTTGTADTDRTQMAITATTTTNADKEPPRYTYIERSGRAPNPDAQPKPKSKLSKFMSKLQSPAVRQTNEARERQKLEEERRGVTICTTMGTPSTATQATAAYF